ncbi:MAG: hypothetical protein ABIH18_07925 [Candidatus Omnitrophota bacterium]
MEIVYAILMAYGFAESATHVIFKDKWNLWPLLLISGLVLIRFFFAPARNLKTIAMASGSTRNVKE